MDQYKFIKDYKSNEGLRKSFNRLAMETFGQGIDFESWYQSGYWNSHYKCYSYVLEGQVIANVSVNEMAVSVEGELKSALQIGTVMTHPNYQRRGLSKMLFDKVFEDYEKEVAYIYLFGNDLAKPLYLKCGFEPLEEVKYESQATNFNSVELELRQLDLNVKNDLDLLIEMSNGRVAVSKKFGVIDDEHLIMFYCSKFMGHTLYYSEKMDTIVSYEIEGATLNLYDIITHRSFELESIIRGLINESVESIQYHFTPDLSDSLYSVSPLNKEDSTLLVKSANEHYQKPFQYPMFSHA